ncbi:MAG: FAD:protein FMN transferase, partial [Serratia symbiotica]|nr:FAD:protein FMN transferase [Serratia symbiotica]
ERPTAGVQQVQLVIQPGEMSIATSGDYRNYFEQDGGRYSHTIDPSTGWPINHQLVSVTVLSPICMTADGLSTGLNVLGPERGIALANLLEIPVLMIVNTGNGLEERYSEAFKPYLKKGL